MIKYAVIMNKKQNRLFAIVYCDLGKDTIHIDAPSQFNIDTAKNFLTKPIYEVEEKDGSEIRVLIDIHHRKFFRILDDALNYPLTVQYLNATERTLSEVRQNQNKLFDGKKIMTGTL